MLNALNEENLVHALVFCENSPFGSIIYSQIKAFYPAAKGFFCHLQKNETGAVTAVASCLEGTANLLTNDKADFDELREFLAFLSPNNLFSSQKCSQFLAFGQNDSGSILRLCAQPEDIPRRTAVPAHVEEIRFLYDILYGESAAAENPPAFGGWYTDVSHRVRHGYARIFVIREGSLPVSMAMTTGETPHCAVVGSVATLPGHRNRGHAGACVQTLAQALLQEGKAVFLFCGESSPFALYHSLGFRPCGHWARAKIQ
ncbi:MAG: GNAT family N-acetyltransferase [Oscillospiraceae bacterium]|jgi:GNAT superfamily N-acetyltransferase|nr:GNAT family N-acetyltransferase [Oscillospiraceae bacterium]